MIFARSSFSLLLILTGFVLTSSAADQKKAPPAKKELFAQEQWYKDAQGKEQTFTGKLTHTPPQPGVIGFGRSKHYTLTMKTGTKVIYIGGKPDILKEYDGYEVKLIGKAVSFELEGQQVDEIWPARLELVKKTKK